MMRADLNLEKIEDTRMASHGQHHSKQALAPDMKRLLVELEGVPVPQRLVALARCLGDQLDAAQRQRLSRVGIQTIAVDHILADKC
jgi:hypothetical protein